MSLSPDVAGDGSLLQLTSAGDVSTLVRASGSVFLVTNPHGDIAPAGARELGLYARDTRHLSHFDLDLSGGQLVLLSSASLSAYNQIDLMLTDVEAGEGLDDPQNFLHVARRQLLDGDLVEQLTLENFLHQRVTLGLSYTFAADFADIFEVRGAHRPRRGTLRPPAIVDRTARLGYDGLDGRTYTTELAFSPEPTFLTPANAVFRVVLAPGERMEVRVVVSPGRMGRARVYSGKPFSDHAEQVRHESRQFRDRCTKFRCDHAVLQAVLDRSTGDLAALRLETAGHPIVAAGIPWFCAPFGRDALVSTYEALILNPELCVSSLRALAAHQGRKDDEETEEEPGKILHELRFGEMARTREMPHRPYYGSVDSTPLFVIVSAALHRATGDVELLRELAPAIDSALDWIDRRSERGTRLVTYAKRSPHGLDNQAWKDSRAGVSFPDGRRARPPIAIVEVQGYCVDAYRCGASIHRALGDRERSRELALRAASLRELVEREMWLEDEQRYAFAVDGDGDKLRTIVSNVGHLLWSRVPGPARARATARTLLSPGSFSGYGIRTLAEGQPVYNPLSYHNGTVWPHDNALIAKGMASYGLTDQASRIFEALVVTMEHFHDRRLPELFCGIGRHADQIVRYPVACSPQAWAAAAPFLLIQTLLGLELDAPRRTLSIRNPRLPPSIKRLEIEDLAVGRSRVSMRFRRVGKRCHVEQLDVSGAPLRTEIEID